MSNQQNVLIQTTGNFTPDLQFGGATTGITYGSRNGIYVKTGNLINFSLSLSLTSKGSATGNASIEGLPFTNSSLVGQATVVASLLILGGSYDTFKGEVDPSSTSISILQEGSNISALVLDDTNFNNTSFVSITGAYFL